MFDFALRRPVTIREAYVDNCNNNANQKQGRADQASLNNETCGSDGVRVLILCGNCLVMVGKLWSAPRQKGTRTAVVHEICHKTGMRHAVKHPVISRKTIE